LTRPATVSDLHEQAAAIADAQPMAHPSLAAALVAALPLLTVVEKGRRVKVEHKGGGSHSYDYADIADVVKLTRPILAQHGIVALTPVHDHGNGLACTVTLLHSSGDRMDLGPFPFPHGHDAQATGSMVTYHRRYALVAALGMAAGDDDDGASATPRRAEPPAPVWDMKMTQFEVKNLLGGDKDEARQAWEFASGDALTEFGPEVAQRIADAWLGRPIEPAAEPAPEENT
jgi:hypothetical protein